MVRECVLGCANAQKLFSFPDPDYDHYRRQEWMRLLGVVNQRAKCLHVCARHFSVRMQAGKHLSRHALPDINLPVIVDSAKDHNYHLHLNRTSFPRGLVSTAVTGKTSAADAANNKQGFRKLYVKLKDPEAAQKDAKQPVKPLGCLTSAVQTMQIPKPAPTLPQIAPPVPIFAGTIAGTNTRIVQIPQPSERVSTSPAQAQLPPTQLPVPQIVPLHLPQLATLPIYQIPPPEPLPATTGPLQYPQMQPQQLQQTTASFVPLVTHLPAQTVPIVPRLPAVENDEPEVHVSFKSHKKQPHTVYKDPLDFDTAQPTEELMQDCQDDGFITLVSRGVQTDLMLMQDIDPELESMLLEIQRLKACLAEKDREIQSLKKLLQLSNNSSIRLGIEYEHNA